jgi:hypothetical protein
VTESGDRRWQLFAAQTTLLGMLCGLLVIPASSVFLGRFGAENMPWTYIAVAAGASVGTPMLARGVRRRTLAAIGVPLWCTVGAIALAGWVGLEWFDAKWVSAPLFVLFPLAILVGFFFVGGQAGRVFDLREMKEQFPRIVLGFPVGFLIASLGGDGLILLLGEVPRLLPFAAASAACLGVLIGVAARRYPAALGAEAKRALVAIEAAGPPRVPLRRLVSNPYVAMLLGYQMLSQLGTQLADFLMFERSAARFTDERELGQFIARYTTGLNILDLVFLLFVAGFLLRRFGMRVGLSVNPLVVTVLTFGAVIAALAAGIDSWAAFVLVLSARAFDIAFTDGATRTALNTAYQAVPTSERLAVQATIEGLGVPFALGLTGVILLVLQQGLGVGATGIAILTVCVGVVWTSAGALVFRSYRATLRVGLEQRLLAPSALDLDDPATRAELDRMLESGDDRLVWTALGALGAQPGRADRLAGLAGSANARVAEVAYRQLRADDPARALAIARSLSDTAAPPVRYAALGMLARHGDADARRTIESALDDADRDTRLATRRAAAGSGDAVLLARVAERARSGADPVTAVAALPVAGEALVTLVADALRGGDSRYTVRLVRQLPATASVVDALAGHLDHDDRDVAVAVRQAIARAGGGPPIVGRIDDLLRSDAARAGLILSVLAALPRDDRAAVLERSLIDELDLTATSVMATLALAIDPALVGHAARGLRSRDERVVARAVETVELHLDQRRARLCIPVIDRRLSAPARLASMRAVTDVPVFDLDGALTFLGDGTARWCRPWLRICAADTRRAFALT